MAYQFLADLMVAIHFCWILFMLTGFVFTLAAFSHGKIFDWWLFRTIHLFGILYVGLLAALGKYCPLTQLENDFRIRHDPDLAYHGSFIIHHLEKIVYPDVPPRIIIIPTMLIALFTLVVYTVRPPARIRNWLR